MLCHTHTSETFSSAQWRVAPRNKTAQNSCAEKQNYVFRSEKEKQCDVVAFLLLQFLILFTSCTEQHRLFTLMMNVMSDTLYFTQLRWRYIHGMEPEMLL